MAKNDTPQPPDDDKDIKTLRKELTALREVTDAQVRQIATLTKNIDEWRVSRDKLQLQYDAYQQAVKDMNRANSSDDPRLAMLRMFGGRF